MKNFKFWFVPNVVILRSLTSGSRRMSFRKIAAFGIILIFTFYILNLLMGCATIIEGAKGVAGISTKVLEDNRKNALTLTFNYDYNTCYNKAQDTLKNIGAYIYAKDTKKNLIAVYVSEEDTTPVGIFFKAIDTTNTQIEVSSPSTFAKEFIATSIFKALNPENK